MLFSFTKRKTTNRAAPAAYASAFENALDAGGLLLNGSKYVSADQALFNSDLYTVIYRLSGDLAACWITANQPRTQALLDNPSTTTNRQAFWQSMFAQMLLDGNAYAYIWRNPLTGQPTRLEYLRPSQVSVYQLDDGTGLVYNVSFDEPAIGSIQNIPQSDMIHFRLFSVGSGGKVGRSPLLSIQNELNLKKAANNLTLNALSKAVTSNGILSIANGAKVSLKDKISMSNAFMSQVTSAKGPVVLDDLTKYTPLEINGDVSKLLASTDWTSTQIAKAYLIPDNYVNGQGDQQSSLQMVQGMYANSLHRYAQSISSELNTKFMATIDVNIEPAVDQDGSMMATTIATITKQGAISPEQANFLLKQVGFLPEDAPKYVAPKVLPKGGDKDDDDTGKGSGV